MKLSKTPEQSAADDALEKAVQDVVRAYGLVPVESLVTDYLVVGEAVQFQDDDSTCDMFLAFRNGHCRLTTALGIMHLGKTHLLSHYGHDRD